jgi:hypothetical protein
MSRHPSYRGKYKIGLGSSPAWAKSNTRVKRAGGMPLALRHLSSKHEALSSNPITIKKEKQFFLSQIFYPDKHTLATLQRLHISTIWQLKLGNKSLEMYNYCPLLKNYKYRKHVCQKQN